MDRRSVLKNLGMITGAAFALPACEWFQTRLPIALKNLNVTLQQEDLLASLVDALIPGDEKTDSIPGAKALDVQNFVWVMVDDCVEPENQKRFMSGIAQFMRYLKKDSDSSFEEMPTETKPDFLNQILAQKAIPVPVEEMVGEEKKELPKPPEYYLEHIQYFLSLTKQFTITGYMQSQFIMTEVMPYKLVPGTYNLCETIDESKRVNINA